MTRGTKRLLLGAAAVAAVSLGFLIEERVRGVAALNRWQAEMRAKGEKFTIAEIVPPAPTNMGCLVLSPEQASSRLATVSSSPDSPPAMRYVAPGKAQAIWQAGAWRLKRKRTNDWAQATGSLEALIPAMGELRADLTNQAFVVRLDYNQGFEVQRPHLGRYRGVAVTLRTATQLALRQKRFDLATENLVAMAALVDLSKGEGLFISELVRDAMASIGVSALWEGLQADGWSETQLAAIQAAWQKPDFMRGMVRVFEVERAVGSLLYDRSRYSLRQQYQVLREAGIPPWWVSGNATLASQLGWLGELLRPVVEAGARFRLLAGLAVWRVAWVEQDQLRHERLMQQAIDCARQAASEKRYRAESWPPRQGAPSSEEQAPGVLPGARSIRHWICATLLPTLERGPEKSVLAEAQRGLAVTALAIKRYQLRHGRVPDRLEALAPEFLSVVPRDWYADTPLHYRTNPDGTFQLYSVGPDGEDNQGDVMPAAANTQPSYARGRDIVWPQPATAEEIAAFESVLR